MSSPRSLWDRLTLISSTARDILVARVEAASPPPPPPPVDVDLGTLPAGKTVTIVFDVTVNGPHPFGTYSNQGTVTWTNSGSVLTDDPSVGGGADPTVTPGDRYNTSTAVVSSQNPSDFGAPVTFTATVTPTEGSGVTPDGNVQFMDGAFPLGAPVACTPAASFTCTAALTTSALTVGSHTITALYQGGTHHDPSNSLGSPVTQVVNTCVPDPVVHSAADSGVNTLRQDLADACIGSTITFDPALVGPITLTSGELSIAKNVTISGPGASTLTITRDGGAGLFRIFHVNPGVTATISGLSITNGLLGTTPFQFLTDVGAGIFNERGTLTIQDAVVSGNTAERGGSGIYNSAETSGSSATLTIVRSTISENGLPNATCDRGGAIFNSGRAGSASATTTIVDSTLSGNMAGRGAAIYNDGTTGAGVVTITNTTISGNIAGSNGGAVYNDFFSNPFGPATVTLTNGTIAGNQSNFYNNGGAPGGGLFNAAGGTLSLRNTILASNSQVHTGAADDIHGDVETATSSHNLVGVDFGMTGVTNGSNGNQVGTTLTPIDPRLGPLANNGGPTMTHALLTGSPAIDAGDNTFVVIPPFPNTSPIHDQRGTAFARIRDGGDGDTTQTVDMGAVEADPTVEDITDKLTDEDVPVAFSFNVGDAATAFDSIAATSSNTTLVPNLPANLDVSGSGSTRTLTITPALNLSGTTTITVTATKTIGGTPLSATDTFVLTVVPVNDPPTLNAIPDPAPIAEDSGQQTVNLSGITAGGGEVQTLAVTASSSNPGLIPDPAVTYSSADPTGSLSYT
ncbi:MAG: hypothetical protein DMF85_19880, partial [Acidobacteria bacterium]